MNSIASLLGQLAGLLVAGILIETIISLVYTAFKSISRRFIKNYVKVNTVKFKKTILYHSVSIAKYLTIGFALMAFSDNYEPSHKNPLVPLLIVILFAGPIYLLYTALNRIKKKLIAQQVSIIKQIEE